jgi:Fe-S-cluster-containing hydrogenase component 2
MPKHLRIYPEKCIGCKSCELACSLRNDGELNSSKSRIKALVFREDKSYTLPYNFPSTCRQCADAPCLASCPVNAVSKTRGKSPTVIIDYEKCIRCGRCVSACPFGAMLFDKEKSEPFKCQLCGGEEPACATICPTGSIVFVQRRAFYSRESALQIRAFTLLKERNRKNTLRKPTSKGDAETQGT